MYFKILLILFYVPCFLQANKMGLPPFFCHNGDPLSTPPPAHCGIPPYQLDPKTMGKFSIKKNGNYLKIYERFPCPYCEV